MAPPLPGRPASRPLGVAGPIQGRTESQAFTGSAPCSCAVGVQTAPRTALPTAEFLEAARDALAFRAARDPEHRAYWQARVLEAARLLDTCTATPRPPPLRVNDGLVVVGARRLHTRLGAAPLAAQVLEHGRASFAGRYATPGAAREALRRFAGFLDRHGEPALAEQVWRIRCERDLVAYSAA